MGNFRKVSVVQRDFSFIYLRTNMCVGAYMYIYAHIHTHTCMCLFAPVVSVGWAQSCSSAGTCLRLSVPIASPRPQLITEQVSWPHRLPCSYGLWRNSGWQPKLYKKLLHFYDFLFPPPPPSSSQFYMKEENLTLTNLHAAYYPGTWSWSLTNAGLV